MKTLAALVALVLALVTGYFVGRGDAVEAGGIPTVVERQVLPPICEDALRFASATVSEMKDQQVRRHTNRWQTAGSGTPVGHDAMINLAVFAQTMDATFRPASRRSIEAFAPCFEGRISVGGPFGFRVDLEPLHPSGR